MRFVLFYQSLISDWNHGNAHFLRGIASELLRRGHQVSVYEPADSWSAANLMAEYGASAVDEFHAQFPLLRSVSYKIDSLDLNSALAGADVVIVHEWNDPKLVLRVAQHRAQRGRYRLFYHDTHHGALTSPGKIGPGLPRSYDGVLAYGEILRRIYIERRWAQHAWTWHEAADTNLFFPRQRQNVCGDVVWIGNWGDDERTEELREFLIEPVRALKLRAKVFGVRYPQSAREALRKAGIAYGGWLPNYRVPEIFAQFKVTLHIPRRPYVESLPGIPTIRPFEALACGIPLICSPWTDSENLFTRGADYLAAKDGKEMKRHLSALIGDRQLARDLADHGLKTIRARHTCGHRVDELMSIVEQTKATRTAGLTLKPKRRYQPVTASAENPPELVPL